MPTLSNSIQSPTNGKIFVSFELSQRANVVLSLKHSVTLQESVVVKGIKNPGIHIVVIDLSGFSAGMIEYTLITRNGTITKTVEKK